ncbi:hypothetical protein LOC68_17300 [Blastopirellula sp. JC732]|uniref:Alpha-2-macroglobulin bait region domain-containing protein n=1 Tax=Blastopirellula sediminis TaxID=2894196 RepID=A0A9X1MMZ3_9BACT|nr:hypothetical protein [Blastopirellula sediminis]MCC9606549.1 hypothetical protein [Blastopirellula sediminis]MCC9630153.1 hypothetical protein [Blastopirellula sediminis]
MTDHDENRQQLLELIYGLLSAEEASQLASRIGRDPELARAYAEMKEQTDLLASAVRMPVAPMPDFAAWKKLAKEEERVERSRSMGGFVRTMQAFTALAAAVLILASAAAVVMNQPSHVAMSTSESAPAVDAAVDADSDAVTMAGMRSSAIELEVAGPRVLNSEVSNRFAVSIRNEARATDPAEITYNFISPQGETVAAGKQIANNGVAKFELPADQALSDLTLEVKAKQGRELVEVKSPQLAAAPPATVTSLALDRPLVRAGDIIRWRSNTLTSQTQQPVDGPVEFDILDPQQKRVAGFVDQGETRQGVAASMWALPPDVVAGNYSLIAKNADGVADVTRFQVDPLAPPVWNARLNFARDWFAPGEEIAASLQLQTQTGQPLANQKLQMLQIVDGQIIDQPQEIETSKDGEANVKLQLAGSAAANVTHHLYFANADQSWAYAAPIPLEPQTVDVNFYPEGGNLVAGLNNRVYFHAADANGKPIELKGAIVNDREEVIAQAETKYRGRGQFDFTPQPDQNYRLTADLGENMVVADLPTPSATDVATIKVPDPVINADEPLEVEVVSRDANQRYGLAYYNNGALVTQQFFAVPQTLKSTRVRLDVPAEIAGAGEVTLYAADQSGQVKPLAERMVFRRPQRQLQIETADLQDEYAAGDHVNIQVATKDEAGQPTSAALGVAVVNENAFVHTTQQSPTLLAAQLLTKRLQRPEELQDPQALLRDDDAAEKELDYILATDGWRQFVKADNRGFYDDNRQAVPAAELAAMSSGFATGVDEAITELPILLLKNKVAPAAEKFAKSTRAKAPVATVRPSVNLTPWVFAAAVATMFGLILLVMLKSAGPAWFWGPAIAFASVAVVAIAILNLSALESSSLITGDQVAIRSAPQAPAPLPTAAPSSAYPNVTAESVMSEMADVELEGMPVGAMGGEKKMATAQTQDRAHEEAEVEELKMQEFEPLSESAMKPKAAEAKVEQLAESGSLPEMSARPMAAPLETAPAPPMAAAPASEPVAPAIANPTPALNSMEERKLDETMRQREIASGAAEAKKESSSRLSGDIAPPAPMMDSMGAARPTDDAMLRSDYAGNSQARYSLSDQKSNRALGQLQQRRGAANSSGVEQELLNRNQAIGATEYGLRKAASQQSGFAQQDQQQMQSAAGGYGGGFGGGQTRGGMEFAAPGAGGQPANAPAQTPAPGMMLSRGAKPPTQAEEPAANLNDKGAAEKQQAKDFYYRAYAYGDADKRDNDGLRGPEPAPETIYWAPLVQTDVSGAATLTFQLPKEPGKYRITIDAVGDGRIGSVRESFSTQPVSDSATPPPTKKASK